jgi:hypothetical protein
MSVVRYLIDESIPEQLMNALIQREPAMEVFIVGQNMASPKGAPDPELLLFAEKEKLALVTFDKKSMDCHVTNHRATGHHTWGIFELRRGFSIRRYVDDLVLIWSASEAEDWRDRIEWLPW